MSHQATTRAQFDIVHLMPLCGCIIHSAAFVLLISYRATIMAPNAPDFNFFLRPTFHSIPFRPSNPLEIWPREWNEFADHTRSHKTRITLNKLYCWLRGWFHRLASARTWLINDHGQIFQDIIIALSQSAMWVVYIWIPTMMFNNHPKSVIILNKN